MVRAVRLVVAARDGYCRVPSRWFGPHGGRSEWAHLGDHRRFKTGGQAPERRHTREGSLMLCTAHHAAYDRPSGARLEIEEMTARGAQGPLAFEYEGHRHEEEG